MISPPIPMRHATLTVLLVGAGSPGMAQIPDIPVGQVVERVVSISDTTQRYAVYVPSNYRPDSVWPVVLITDPRGRALVPLHRLQEPAERLGYILISSYNTLSDGSNEPNEAAAEAMIVDAQQLFSIDGRRLYFVGFSGTARIAWTFGVRLSDYVAGIIGFGAGLPTPDILLVVAQAFGFYGGAGIEDFNYEEVLKLDWTLDKVDVPHRVASYDGPHAWPPAEVFADALEWMEIQAMRGGLRAPDSALVASLLGDRLDRAQAYEDAGAPFDAWLEYRDVAASFEGLRDVTAPAARAKHLASTSDVRRAQRVLREIVEERRRFDEALHQFLGEARNSMRAFETREASRHLDLESLAERAARNDPTDAPAARRMLEEAFVRFSFYEPQRYMELGAAEMAVAALQVANEIKPDHPRVCFGLARAHAQLRHLDKAFDALECVVTNQTVRREQLEGDPQLAPLRDDPRFEEMMKKRSRTIEDDRRRSPRG